MGDVSSSLFRGDGQLLNNLREERACVCDTLRASRGWWCLHPRLNDLRARKRNEVTIVYLTSTHRVTLGRWRPASIQFTVLLISHTESTGVQERAQKKQRKKIAASGGYNKTYGISRVRLFPPLEPFIGLKRKRSLLLTSLQVYVHSASDEDYISPIMVTPCGCWCWRWREDKL